MSGSSWEKLDISFGFEGGTRRIKGGEEWWAVYSAFKLWAESGYFRFEEVDAASADIVISWRDQDDVPPTIPVAAPYLAFSGQRSGTQPVEIIFNSRVIWNTGGATLRLPEEWGGFLLGDVESVAVTELGHALGLEYTNSTHSVLNRNRAFQSPIRSLESDDEKQLHRLYGFAFKPPQYVIQFPKLFGGDPEFLDGDYVNEFEGKEAVFPWCPFGIDVTKGAILNYEVAYVDHNENVMAINGVDVVGGIRESSDMWTKQASLVPPGVLHAGFNEVVVGSRTEAGAATGAVDDFIIKAFQIDWTLLDGLGKVFGHPLITTIGTGQKAVEVTAQLNL